MTPLAPPYSLLVAEDHDLTRMGLVYSLGKHSGVKIAGEAENGLQAVQMVSRLAPDVVLMDIGLPVMDGIEATRRIKEALPEVKVIILSSRKEPQEIIQAMSAGADGYCLKDIAVDKLVQTLEMICQGGVWLDEPVAKIVMGALPASQQHWSKLASLYSPPDRL